ncbi:MAG: glutamyl-tRNA reductase [Planctomycetota bacterium]|nr:glutamyl-tRNA reductase [Planctomycetota bacterium]
MPTRKLSVIGLNHQTAPVAVREAFALGPDLSRRLLKRIHGEDAFEEVLVLDTCNRTEVYFVTADASNPLAYLVDHIGRLKGTAPSADPALFYRHDGLAAVEHLFRVAASLDSQIVGEHQILGQVKAAYRLAVEAHSVRFLLNKLLHWAFRVGKRVQTETDLGRGSAGIAQAAVELARRHLGRLEGKTILLVGAGRNAELAARILLRAGAGRLVVANRTVERARRLAEGLMRLPKGKEIPADETADNAACPALLRQATPEAAASEDVGGAGEPLRPEAVGLEEIPRLIGSMDLVLASTASPGIVLDYETLAEPIAASGRPLVILDIALPRDADPRLGHLPNVRLFNLDDLERLVEENLDRRRAEIPRAETIVAEEVRAFDKWVGSLQVAPTIRLLQKRLEQIQQDLVRQYGSRFSDAEQPQLEQFTQSLCGRLLHDPLTFLRGLSEEAPLSETLATVEIIRRMFDLDALEQDE